MRKKLYIFILLLFLIPFHIYAKRGCCSHHGGVSGCAPNGRQICNDGTYSPTCTCDSSSEYSSNAYNYNKIVYGCTNSNAINYDSSANTDDGSCIEKKFGCTNSNAINYDSSANTDDGSCIEKKFGCMDSEAINYNPAANVSNSSCRYQKETTVTKTIKYKTIYKKNNRKYRNYKKVKQRGKNGKKQITYIEIKNEYGSVISKKVKNEKIIYKSKNKIIEVGTKKHFYEF